MAIVKFGVVVVGARGTIGGMKFSANGAGPYASQWAKGSNPRSSAQSDQRALIGTIASSWRNLSQAQRDDWDDYALQPAQEKTNSLGLDYFPSGFNWYVAINQNLSAADEATRVDAPTLTRSSSPEISAVTSLRETGGTPDSIIAMGPFSPNPTFNHVVHTMLRGLGTTVFAGKKPFTLIAVPDFQRLLFPQAALEATFGNISLDQRAFYEVQVQDSQGQRSPSITFRVDAEA